MRVGRGARRIHLGALLLSLAAPFAGASSFDDLSGVACRRAGSAAYGVGRLAALQTPEPEERSGPQRLEEADEQAVAILSEARSLLEARMPVTASRTLARELSTGRISGDEAVLLVAHANAERRTWDVARRLLVGRGWASEESAGEAARLLARAYLEMDSVGRAAAVYERFLDRAPRPAPVDARVGYARALDRGGSPDAAAAQLAEAARDHPAIARWLGLSRLYALARARDPAAFALADTLLADRLVPADSVRLPAARLAFELGDPERGMELVRRAGDGVRAELASGWVAPRLLRSGDRSGAARAYRAALERGDAGPEVGPALLELERTWESLRDVGLADLRAGRVERGRAALREARELAPDSAQPGLVERLAASHRASGHHERAIQLLVPWLDTRDLPPERLASMWLLAGRSFTALGRSREADEAFEIAATGTGASAALAAYLLADDHDDAGRPEEARRWYETVAARFPRTIYGDRAMSRLALIDFREGRLGAARERLESYRRRNPGRSWSLGALYWIGRTHEAQGDTARAAELYRRVVRSDPLDYYAILAARRIGADPWAALELAPPRALPQLDLAHRTALARMDLLRDLGWDARARRELQAARDAGPDDADRLLALARALNDGGWTQDGIRLAWLVRARSVRWSRPLLEAIYPLPFRRALEDAARARGLSAGLVAGLARRESLFDPQIVSSANAVGVMQLLPRTAEDVARAAGLPEYRREQLTVAQVNLLLGTRYLADLLARFGGSRVAALISYNAGPHRYVRWRDFPEAEDEEQFVERIPFRETREYVRAVTRLAHIYDRLYGPWEAGEPAW